MHSGDGSVSDLSGASPVIEDPATHVVEGTTAQAILPTNDDRAGSGCSGELRMKPPDEASPVETGIEMEDEDAERSRSRSRIDGYELRPHLVVSYAGERVVASRARVGDFLEGIKSRQDFEPRRGDHVPQSFISPLWRFVDDCHVGRRLDGGRVRARRRDE